MTKAELLNNEHIADVQSQYDEAGISFDPILDAAIRRFGITNDNTVVVIEEVVKWLLKQLAKAVKKSLEREPKTWLEKLLKEIFG